MPEYDFSANLQEDLDTLHAELSHPDLPGAITDLSRRFGVTEAEMTAALWRTSKRHGETIAVFARELHEQFQREVARTGEPATAAAGPQH